MFEKTANRAMLVGVAVYGVLLLIVPSIVNELKSLVDFVVAFLNNNLMNATIPVPIIEFFRDMFNDQEVVDAVKAIGSGDFVSLFAERFPQTNQNLLYADMRNLTHTMQSSHNSSAYRIFLY